MSIKVGNAYSETYVYSFRQNRFSESNVSIFSTNQKPVPIDKKRTAAEREKAIQNGTLKYFKEKKGGFFCKDQPAYYEYTANGKEFLIQIKNKFGIKDKALQKFNPTYKNDDCKPTAGTIIRFYASDVE